MKHKMFILQSHSHHAGHKLTDATQTITKAEEKLSIPSRRGGGGDSPGGSSGNDDGIYVKS